MKRIALIGSTGSIGKTTLDIIRRYPNRYKVVSLTAHSNGELLLSQAKEFCPSIVCCDNLQNGLDFGKIEVFSGEDSYVNAITENVDMVVVAVVGFAGLKAVLKAIEMGKTIALANKESLVVGGELITKLAKEKNIDILPIDSEHSAIWQSLGFNREKSFKRLIITASGGPFRTYSYEDMKRVTVSDALNHPTWKMGGKITIDSATMLNKGLEVIEAHWLYNAPYEKIDVIVHKESIIHSFVEYEDNAVIAELSYPTMEIPISLALSYPERIETVIPQIDLAKICSLNFEPLDEKRFPCFRLAVESGKKGGLYPAIMNGANEEAVSAFLSGKIAYTEIAENIEKALNVFNKNDKITLENLVNADRFAREVVKNNIG